MSLLLNDVIVLTRERIVAWQEVIDEERNEIGKNFVMIQSVSREVTLIH